MTVLETKQKIESELKAAAESFGAASSLVDYSVEVEVNQIDGAPEDITCIFGSFSIGPEGSDVNDRLYLPLDAELNDDDIVDEESFNENLAKFHEKVSAMRDKVLASNDYNATVKAIIEKFDQEMDELYNAEIKKLETTAKKNLTIAAIGVAIAAVMAALILLADKLL